MEEDEDEVEDVNSSQLKQTVSRANILLEKTSGKATENIKEESI